MAVNTIGVVSGLFTIVGFFQSNFPGDPSEGATVTIKSGLSEYDDAEEASLGGSISKIYSFNADNNPTGEVDGGGVDPGGILTKTVAQDVAGVRAEYVSIANNNDATCISWIAVSQFDQTDGGSWSGDIGANCGQLWYNSIEEAGDDYIPKCTWLDGDHTNEIASAALKFKVGAYGNKVDETEALQQTIDSGEVCSYTSWGPDNGPISGTPGPAKRALRSRPEWMEQRLVISKYKNHTAKELCSSDTSFGPDTIGPDGKFCDMGTKTLYALCSSEDVDGCVDLDEDLKALAKRRSVAKREVNILHKSYKTVSKWGF